MGNLSFFQVSNEAHCIKVATDFVSPESLSMCVDLSAEFRNDNLAEAWKDDVLQLNSLLYFAWVSLQRPLGRSRAKYTSQHDSEASQSGPSLKPHTPLPTGTTSKKRKFRGGENDHQSAKRTFRCPICPSHTKPFLAHGLMCHMYVTTTSPYATIQVCTYPPGPSIQVGKTPNQAR